MNRGNGLSESIGCTDIIIFDDSLYVSSKDLARISVFNNNEKFTYILYYHNIGTSTQPLDVGFQDLIIGNHYSSDGNFIKAINNDIIKTFDSIMSFHGNKIYMHQDKLYILNPDTLTLTCYTYSY